MILSAFDNLAFTCNAVLPIILIIMLGYFLKRIKLLPDGFWKMANKLCFKICLPAMLFINIYNVSDIAGIAKQWRIVLFCVIAILLVFGLGLLYVIFFVKEDKQKGVILQCVYRSNFAIIGVSLAESLSAGRSEPVALAAVISAISIPLYNVLAIISLSIFVHDGNSKASVKDILIKIIKNPLIIGVCLGILFLGFRALLSIGRDTPLFTIKDNVPFLYTTINNLKLIASPLALLALGGDFTFSAISRLKKQIIAGTLARILIVPVACLVVAYLLNKSGTFFGMDNSMCFPALIALFGTPVAVSSAPMAAEMNNDDELAGQLVVWTSITSALTLFFIIFVCSLLGIFAI